MTAQAHDAMKHTLDMDFDEADGRVQEAPGEEGFGVLTEIEFQASLREKLGADIRRYLILGACDPRLAHPALQADGDIGLLSPCNVVVQQGERPGPNIVEAMAKWFR